MTNLELTLWKNCFLASAVSTIEVGFMFKDELTQEEKKALNSMMDKFNVMLRSFDKAVESNPSFQHLVGEYNKFTEKVVDGQLKAFLKKDEKQ